MEGESEASKAPTGLVFLMLDQVGPGQCHIDFCLVGKCPQMLGHTQTFGVPGEGGVGDFGTWWPVVSHQGERDKGLGPWRVQWGWWGCW